VQFYILTIKKKQIKEIDTILAILDLILGQQFQKGCLANLAG